jgi:DNA-binding MarR family transcriptional regulator
MYIPGSLDPDYELWQLFTYTHRLISSASANRLRKQKLTHNMVAILSLLYQMDHDPMPIELARIGKRTPQTITSALDRMEKQGLLKRVKDKQRKNSFRISLTEKGHRVYCKAAEINVYHKIMSTLSDDKRKLFKECLFELMSNANKYC